MLQCIQHSMNPLLKLYNVKPGCDSKQVIPCPWIMLATLRAAHNLLPS